MIRYSLNQLQLFWNLIKTGTFMYLTATENSKLIENLIFCSVFIYIYISSLYDNLFLYETDWTESRITMISKTGVAQPTYSSLDTVPNASLSLELPRMLLSGRIQVKSLSHAYHISHISFSNSLPDETFGGRNLI